MCSIHIHILNSRQLTFRLESKSGIGGSIFDVQCERKGEIKEAECTGPWMQEKVYTGGSVSKDLF